jgi:hypothetical protein
MGTWYSPIRFRSKRFNTTNLQAHFINPNCFGEDVGIWLREELRKRDVRCEMPSQEDWGWYLDVKPPPGSRVTATINVGWNGVEFAGKPIPPEDRAWSVWVITGGSGCLSWWFGKVDDARKFGAEVHSKVLEVLKSAEEITVLERATSPDISPDSCLVVSQRVLTTLQTLNLN